MSMLRKPLPERVDHLVLIGREGRFVRARCDCGNEIRTHRSHWGRNRTCGRSCPFRTVSPADRYWAKVQKTDACWGWTAATDNHGYGFIMVNKVPKKAHRISWELHHGPIPDGLHVLHKCDNPRCSNPDHLFLGTHSDNMLDKVRKGRHGGLSVEQVQEVRRRVRRGDTQTLLAAELRVHISTINAIVRGRNWSHVQ